MKNILRISAFGLPLTALFLAGCPSDPVTPDAFTAPMPDAFVAVEDDAFVAVEDDAFVAGDAPAAITNDCAGYCTQITTNCTGANSQYVDNADCLAQCNALNWPAGTPGATDGNTIACRIYHGGTPALGAGAAEHCPHAGSSGGGVCGASVTFNAAASSTATRIDRMGMPAVATAAISSAMKNAYNDGDPSDDAALMFATDQITTLTGIHAALDDDLTTAGFVPCNMSPTVEAIDVGGGLVLPECLGQNVLGPMTPRVYQLVIPDTLVVNPGAVSRFPNGRDPDDVVIDITLAAVLLDLSVTGQTAGSLAALPLNPPANAAGEVLTTFPYFGAPQAP